jgi:enoyl-CoA hydratase/carnithine racemase
MISQSDTLTLDLKNGLLIISLNRPAQSNALNGELVDALFDVFTRLERTR